MAEFRAAWWWIDRWRKSTAYTDMTAEQQGVYRNLLDELWLRGGALPASEKALAQISGDAQAWPRVKDVVLARFYQENGCYRHETHDEVASQSKTFREAQREAGQARAAKAERGPDGRFLQPGRPAGSSSQNQPEVQPEIQPPSPSPSKSPSKPSSSTKASPSTKKTPPPAWAVGIARDLEQAIRDHKPDFKRTNAEVEKWADQIRLMVERDYRSQSNILRVIRWVHRDDRRGFWRKNILSGAKLRKQFDRLEMEMNEDPDFRDQDQPAVKPDTPERRAKIAERLNCQPDQLTYFADTGSYDLA